MYFAINVIKSNQYQRTVHGPFIQLVPLCQINNCVAASSDFSLTGNSRVTDLGRLWKGASHTHKKKFYLTQCI